MPRPRNDDVSIRPGRAGWFFKDYAGSGNLKLLPGTEPLSHDDQGRHQARVLLAEFRRRESIGLQKQSVLQAAKDVGRVAVSSPSGRDKLTISELFEIARKRSRGNNTKKTSDSYIQKWDTIERWCSEHDPPIVWPTEVTRSLVERFKEELKAYIVKRYSTRGWDGRRSVNRHLTAWRHAWSMLCNPEDPPLYMFEPGELNFDLLFPMGKEPTREDRPIGLTKEQLDAIVEKETDPFYKLVWTFARGSGFRDDEIRHLGPEDLSSPKKGLFLAQVTGKPLGFCRCHKRGKHEKGFEPKYHQKRTVSVSKQTYDAGTKLTRQFLPQLQNPSSKTMWSALQLACARAGAPAISMHDFRYNWASHLYATGKVTLEQVSRGLGHKDVRTTEIYLRITDTRLLPSSELPF